MNDQPENTPVFPPKHEDLRLRTGSVDTGTPLVTLLYLLMEEQVLPGTMEELVQRVEHPDEDGYHSFSNGYLAHYAIDLARRLEVDVMWRDDVVILEEAAEEEEDEPLFPMDSFPTFPDPFDRARNEMEVAGLYDEDADYDGAVPEAVLELLSTLYGQGHSGYSAHLVVELFSRLARGETLTPITTDPDEWYPIALREDATPGLWQNLRDSSRFSEDGGRTHWGVDDPDRHTTPSAEPLG